MDRNLQLQDSKTFENLKQAFFDEASLAYRYRYFATIARFEGLDRLASLFHDFAEGGSCNVHGCLDFLRATRDPSADIPLGGTHKNLESIVQTETRQCSEMYPEMARIARDEGFADVASWFETLEKLKRSHLRKITRLSDDG